jgi:mRNA-degrading endonuclease RelE of RelBE toxin-antitoxin system
MQILQCVDRYLASRIGDVKKPKPPLTGFRLRCGDYRVFFDLRLSIASIIVIYRVERNVVEIAASCVSKTARRRAPGHSPRL